MKNKPPRTESQSDSRSSIDRLVGANRLFERDVLMEAPRRESRTRASIIGDKKLTAKDSVSAKATLSKTTELKGASSKTVSTKPSTKTATPKTVISKTIERSVNSFRSSESTSAQQVRDRDLAQRNSSVVQPEKRNRVVFDDPLVSRSESSLRRERGYSNVLPQGNSSAVDEVRAKVTKKIAYRAIGLLLLLSSFAVIAYFATGPLTNLLERPLKSVAVEGQFQFLPKDRAMELINNEIDGDFLQLNLDRLKNVLQADPWVDRVSLSRRWPDTLVVKIAEQKPIARWDANGFLNQRGEIIRVSETDKLSGLPWLQGNEKNTREIMQQYQDVSTLLRSRGLEIIALKCDNKKSWRITLKNDVEIAIGRDQVMEKLRRFVTVYDKFLSTVWGDVKAIDVRYTNGVSVRWMPDSEMAKKYLKPEIVTPKVVPLKR